MEKSNLSLQSGPIDADLEKLWWEAWRKRYLGFRDVERLVDHCQALRNRVAELEGAKDAKA